MNLRGFWNKNGPKTVRKTQFAALRLKGPPATTAPQGTWLDHPDREAVSRAEKALPIKQVHRDS